MCVCFAFAYIVECKWLIVAVLDIQCDVSVDITATVVVRRGCENVIFFKLQL